MGPAGSKTGARLALDRHPPAVVIKPPGDLPYRLVYLDDRRQYSVLVDERDLAA